MIHRVRVVPAMVVVACCLQITSLPAEAQAVPASSLTGRAITAIGYQVGGGSTKVDLRSTGLIAHPGERFAQRAPSGASTRERFINKNRRVELVVSGEVIGAAIGNVKP